MIIYIKLNAYFLPVSGEKHLHSQAQSEDKSFKL